MQHNPQAHQETQDANINQTIQVHEIVFNINPSRRLALIVIVGLLAVAVLALLAQDSNPVEASEQQAPAAVSSGSAGMRKFYLTSANYSGANADGASVCLTGYHFASIWELLDVSNLEYDANAYAETREDSGEGPLTVSIGWVRTGYNGSYSSNSTAGEANCGAWFYGTSAYKGTIASLPSDWTNPANANLGSWSISLAVCDTEIHVWCIED
jgi:hypothetical protein